jgi:hypothetical protein
VSEHERAELQRAREVLDALGLLWLRRADVAHKAWARAVAEKRPLDAARARVRFETWTKAARELRKV